MKNKRILSLCIIIGMIVGIVSPIKAEAVLSHSRFVKGSTDTVAVYIVSEEEVRQGINCDLSNKICETIEVDEKGEFDVNLNSDEYAYCVYEEQRMLFKNCFSNIAVDTVGNTVTVNTFADNDGIAMLIKPGYTYSDLKDFSIFECVEDVQYVSSVDGKINAELNGENISSDYHIFLSSGDECLFIPLRKDFEKNKIYVSPLGNDSDSGSYEKPLRTLGAARETAKKRKEFSENVEVVFSPGEYEYENISLTNADSDIKFVGNGATFKGTKTIPYSSFKKVTDGNILQKVIPEAGQRLIYVDLSTFGYTKEQLDFTAGHVVGSEVSPLGVYVDEKRQMLSRYPNSGYMYIDEVSQIGGKRRYAENPGLAAVFYQYDDNVSRWINADNAYMAGYIGSEFWSEWAEIATINSEDSSITLNDWTQYGVLKNYKWYITNLIEEIDIPGEWYIDSKNCLLYYYPASDFGENSCFEIANAEEPLINITGGQNISFDNFNIFGINADGIDVADSKNISFTNMDISHTKGFGIKCGGENITIDNCHIHNTYDAGIYVTNGGDRNTLTSSGNVISNNHLYNTGSDSGINWNGGIYLGRNNVGTKVCNNLIHSIKNYAYSYGGNENIFSHNEVWSSNRESADSTPVYSGRDLSEYGNEISFNYIHECFNPDNNQYGNFGIGSGDDWESGAIIKNNIVYSGKKSRTTNIGTHSRDNTIQYNISICAANGLSAEDRDRWIPNVLNSSNFPVGSLTKSVGLNSGYATTDIWLKKYPQISTIYDDIVSNDGKFIVRDNVITDNVSVDSPNYIISSQQKYSTIENNLDIDDYGIFVDFENQDYRITATAMKKYNLNENILNENNFDMREIGIQGETEPVKSEFQLTYPYNNQNVTAKSINFSWTNAEYADEYILEISQNSDFSNIEKSKTVIGNNTSVDGLLSNTKYYWRVTAINKSKQIGNRWDSTSKTQQFYVSDADFTYSDWRSTNQDNGVNIKGIIRNNTLSICTGDIYAAFYDENNILCALKKQEIEIGKEDSISFDETYNDIPAYNSLKVFVWENLTPVLNEPVYPIREIKIPAQSHIVSDSVRTGSWSEEADDQYSTYLALANSSKAEFEITTPTAGVYDLYYRTTPSSEAVAAPVQIAIAGGVFGGRVYTTTINTKVSEASWVWIGRYTLTAPDGSGVANITTSSENGVISASAVKAIEVK